MNRLRRSPLLIRAILVWFALFLGAGMVSAAVHTEGAQWVCSAGGAVKWVAASDDADADPSVPAGLHCPLCVTVTPPPLLNLGAVPPTGEGMRLHVASTQSPPRLRQVACSLPARGPPAFFL
jgi:hypothetical protein